MPISPIMCSHPPRPELERTVGRATGLTALTRTVDAHRRFVESSPDALRAMLILWFESISPGAAYTGNVAQVQAVQRQQAVVEAFPRSRAALAFRKMADKADRWPLPSLASGQVEFFVERLIHARQDMAGCTA